MFVIFENQENLYSKYVGMKNGIIKSIPNNILL